MNRITWNVATSSVAVVAILAVALGAAPPGGGSTPPPNPAIAYADGGIKVMNADGTNIRTLVSLRRGETARAPAWGPGNTQLVFWGRLGGVAGVYTVPLAGGAPRLVARTRNTAVPTWADWSPSPTADGTFKIVFTDDDGTGWNDIYAVNPDGTGLVNLTSTPEFHELDLAWSPDGRYLAASRDFVDLVILDIGLLGGAVAIVGERVVVPLEMELLPSSPRWSNAGTTITLTGGPIFAPSRIMQVDLTDPAPIPVVLTSNSTSEERWSSFSPDDSRLAFHRSGSGGGIFTINADGTGEIRINSRGTDPNWRRSP